MEPEVKTLFDEQMKTFEAFKAANDQLETEVKKLRADVVTSDKVEKISKSLDGVVEKLTAESKAAKTRSDEIEAKTNRIALNGGGERTEKLEGEIKSFNALISTEAAAKHQQAVTLDQKGYGEYKAAFGRFLRTTNLTPDEVKTLYVGSDPDGGYWVTPDLGGTIVKKVYESSPVRENASVQTIGTDALEGMEDLGEAGAGYAGEQAQGSDTTTPQIGKWRIDVFIIDTEPKATQKLLDDANVDVEAWLAGKVADKFARFENSEFVTGAANKIRGFMAGYTISADSGSGVTWGTLGYVATGTSADFAGTNPGDKIITLMGTLKNAYLANAKWYTRRSVIVKMRSFKDGQGNYLWKPVTMGTPESFFEYPIVRMEDVPALAANSYSLAFGDLRQAYQVVDRQGIRVLRDPFTSKPYVKFYTTKRTGGGVINFEAIKLLKFGTS